MYSTLWVATLTRVVHETYWAITPSHMEITMYDAQLADSSFIVSLNDINDNPNYDTMSLDEILGEDTKPMFECATMDEIRRERASVNALNELLDLQDRMSKGMSMIKEMQRKGDEYSKAKAAFDKAKTVMFANNTRKPQSWWDKFNQLKDTRNAAWNEFDKVRPVLNKYWAHWMELKEQGCFLAQEYGLWSEFFRLQNEEINKYFTHAGDIEDQSVDSRHMNTVDALCLSYIEEQEAHRAEENKPFTIYVRSSGPVMSDEEWDALLSSY